MCIVFFKKNASKAVKLIVIFNRDEQISRAMQRSKFGVHFGPQKIACAYDHQANGTWLGINLDTGNYGFLTNYEKKPFTLIKDPKYRKGNLLMDFLKKEHQFTSPMHYEEHLDVFLKEGQKFNGTNIWLGNIHEGDHIAFSHNQKEGENLTFIKSDDIYGFGNGDVEDEWFKQKLGKELIAQSLHVFKNHVPHYRDRNHTKESLNLLKDLLFRVSECNYKPPNKEDWINVDLYSEQERYWNSGIFLDKHEERLGHSESSYYATVSSTVMLGRRSDELNFYERVYNHEQQRKNQEYHDELARLLIQNHDLDFLKEDDFSQVDYEEEHIYHKFK